MSVCICAPPHCHQPPEPATRWLSVRVCVLRVRLCVSMSCGVHISAYGDLEYAHSGRYEPGLWQHSTRSCKSRSSLS
eukprot:159542-Rhodomonas_salina.1